MKQPHGPPMTLGKMRELGVGAHQPATARHVGSQNGRPVPILETESRNHHPELSNPAPASRPQSHAIARHSEAPSPEQEPEPKFQSIQIAHRVQQGAANVGIGSNPVKTLDPAPR
jgi:hypothetical protein